MYISKKELAKLTICVNYLESMVGDQEFSQNNLFIEGLENVSIDIQEARNSANKILDRETRAMALRIISKRKL